MDWELVLVVSVIAALAYSAGFGHRGVLEREAWKRDMEAREIARAKLQHPGFKEWGRGGWDG